VLRRSIINELKNVESLQKLDVEDAVFHVEREVDRFESRFCELFSSEAQNDVPKIPVFSFRPQLL